MKRIISNIFNCFITCIVGLALIGIHVNTIYCGHCEEKHVHVEIVPVAEDTCCEDGCDHGHNCKTDTECNLKELQLSAFYKITDSSETEEGLRLIVLFSYLEEHVPGPCVIACGAVSNYFSNWDNYPDLPVTQESLCIYRC